MHVFFDGDGIINRYINDYDQYITIYTLDFFNNIISSSNFDSENNEISRSILKLESEGIPLTDVSSRMVSNRFDSTKILIGGNGGLMSIDLTTKDINPIFQDLGAILPVAYGSRQDVDSFYFCVSSNKISDLSQNMHQFDQDVVDIIISDYDSNHILVLCVNSVHRGLDGTHDLININGLHDFSGRSFIQGAIVHMYDQQTAAAGSFAKHIFDECYIVSTNRDIYISKSIGGAGDPPVKWKSITGSLPNVYITSFVYDTEDDILLVGTRGRGVWKLDALSRIISDLIS